MQQLVAQRTEMPIIFITGHGDVPTTVHAMKAGAVEFLTKPFGDDVLLDAIRGRSSGARCVRQEAEIQALRAATHSSARASER